MASEPLVEAKGVGVRFGANAVLQNVDLAVGQGRIVTVVGPNGAGKSTLLRVMLGLVTPDAGTVARRPGMRVGYVPQRLVVEPTLPMTVRRFLRLAVTGRDESRIPAALDRVRARRVIERQMNDLSGGELQRVLLARAILRRPDLMVLDEPLGGVDVAGQAELYDLIARLRDDLGCGVLMVSHDLHLVMAATDDVVCLNRHVCCAGHPEAVSRHPEYVALFGESLAASLAVYTHRHDHAHDIAGGVVPEHRHDHDHGPDCRHG